MKEVRQMFRLVAVASYQSGVPLTLFTSKRLFINRVEDIVFKAIAPVVDKFQGKFLFADERMVTEPRRKLSRQPAMEESLPQRLQRQRRVQQALVPSEIRVSKSRLSISFTWPWTPQPSKDEELRVGKTTENPPVSHDVERRMPTLTNQPNDATTTTTALAEYLRVYTPSTDGTFATDRVVYGRRGVMIKDITPIGNYAIRISFSDDHNAGIYSYDYLYHLTSPEHKYRLMRQYIQTLRAQRKSRTAPRRVASSKRLENKRDENVH